MSWDLQSSHTTRIQELNHEFAACILPSCVILVLTTYVRGQWKLIRRVLWQSLTNYKEANSLSALQLTSQMCFLLKYALLFCTSKTDSDKKKHSQICGLLINSNIFFSALVLWNNLNGCGRQKWIIKLINLFYSSILYIYFNKDKSTKYASLAADAKQTDFVINKQEMVTESAPPLEGMGLGY